MNNNIQHQVKKSPGNTLKVSPGIVTPVLRDFETLSDCVICQCLCRRVCAHSVNSVRSQFSVFTAHCYFRSHWRIYRNHQAYSLPTVRGALR